MKLRKNVNLLLRMMVAMFPFEGDDYVVVSDLQFMCLLILAIGFQDEPYGCYELCLFQFPLIDNGVVLLDFVSSWFVSFVIDFQYEASALYEYKRCLLLVVKTSNTIGDTSVTIEEIITIMEVTVIFTIH